LRKREFPAHRHPRRDTLRQRDKQTPQSAEETIRDVRRATRRHISAEETVRIVLDGLRGEDSIAEICRKEGIADGEDGE